MEISTTFSATFLHSLLPLETKIIFPRISFRAKKINISNQYNLYSRTIAYVSSIIEGVYFTLSYTPVAAIISICIIISIEYAEVLIIFILDISNTFQNTILPNPEEKMYLSLPHLYLEFPKRRCPRHPLSSINPK